MISVCTSAPGKIVLCGEYVVLDGAPAIGAAVDRRVRVSIVENSVGHHRVRCPGYVDESISFRIDERGEFAWQTGGSQAPDFSLLEQIWRSFNPGQATTYDLLLDSRPFIDPVLGSKLGLGSSAALAVAFAAGLAGLRQQTADLEATMASHRRFQNGRGSGIDIAVARCGGVIEYRMGKPAAVMDREFPKNLEFAILWSGAAASTATQLERLDAAVGHSESRARLALASEKIVDAWPIAGAEDIIGLFEEYVAALGVFSVAHKLGIFEAGHSELVEVAHKHGAVYKPCGAGGGDVGIVLSTSEESISSFVAAATGLGFKPLEINIGEVGLVLGEQEK